MYTLANDDECGEWELLMGPKTKNVASLPRFTITNKLIKERAAAAMRRRNRAPERLQAGKNWNWSHHCQVYWNVSIGC